MIITQTPLRVSFAGGGTDLAEYYAVREGYVVSAAIDKAVFVIVTDRCDEKIYVNYSRKEIVDRVDEIQHELVREAMRVAGVENGVEISLLSDIPSEGSGLGSSSSFTVGLLNALHTFRGEQVGAAQLAEEACDIEIARCGKPIGKQDQYIAAFGGLCGFRFRRDGSVETERIPLTPDELARFTRNLFLFFTNKTRKAADILSEQKRETPARLEYLDRIRELAEEVRGTLRTREFDRVGRILDENWRQKKQLASRVTNGDLDGMYQRALESGATGGKICGAGGGGFLLLYAPPDRHESLLRGMSPYREMPFFIDAQGSRVIFNYRRPAWKLHTVAPALTGTLQKSGEPSMPSPLR